MVDSLAMFFGAKRRVKRSSGSMVVGGRKRKLYKGKTVGYITAHVQVKLTLKVKDPGKNAAQFADIEERAPLDAEEVVFVNTDVALQDTTDATDADVPRFAEDVDVPRFAEDVDVPQFVGVRRQEEENQDMDMVLVSPL